MSSDVFLPSPSLLVYQYLHILLYRFTGPFMKELLPFLFHLENSIRMYMHALPHFKREFFQHLDFNHMDNAE
jgi:hypothetical protein